MKALFIFISIIFFSPFLLLNTPAFGQEDLDCLSWVTPPCEEWKTEERIICSPMPIAQSKKVLSPVKPDPVKLDPVIDRECHLGDVQVCVKREERYCIKWGINLGKIDMGITERAFNTALKDILANKVNDRLDNRLGATIDNPILPSDITIKDGRITFHINITIEVVGKIEWYDPVIAVGYNYFIDHGPRVRDIKLPKGIGDNKYNLWIFNPESNDFTDSGVELVGGEKYKLEEPVRKFSIRGIEVDAELDPENQRAFPTGLAFDRTGKVRMRMVPITVDTDKQ